MHALDEKAWRLMCEHAARNAVAGSGQSETMWLHQLHCALESHLQQFEPADQERALEIAKQYGYADDEQLKDDAKWNAGHGYCIHGIDPKWCPAGCGDQAEYDELDDSD